MTLTTEHVLDYLDSHPLRFHNGDFTSLLDMLHTVYTESNPVDTVEIRKDFSKLRGILDQLPPEDAEKLFDLICGLCRKYEQTSFAHGIIVGLYLHTELSTLH